MNINKMEETPKHIVKPRFWFGFSIGLLSGLFIAVGFYFADKLLDDPVRLLVTAPQDTVGAEAADSTNFFSHFRSRKTAFRKEQTSEARSVKDSSILYLEDDTLENVEFAMEMENDGEENVVQNKGIASRKMHVSNLNASIEPEYETLEVEQWSEFVKNKYSYHRSGNTLKIRGINIQEIKISFNEEGEYVMEYRGHHYPIPENQDFTRLYIRE